MFSKNTAQHILKTSSLILLGYVFFGTANILLHFLRPDLTLLQTTISDFANGPYGWLMQLALVVLGVASLLLTICLSKILLPGKLKNTALTFFLIMNLSTITVGIFKVDAAGADTSLSGTIHLISAFLCFTAFLVGSIAFSFYIRHDDAWKNVRPYLKYWAWAGIPLFCLLALPVEYRGLSEKIYTADIVIFLAFLAVQIRSKL